MRISDWSSDVCSSDLLERDDPHVQPEGSSRLMNPISPSISPSTGAPRRTRSTGAPRRTGRFAWTLRRAGLALALTLAAATPAMAELRLDITRGQVEPMPIRSEEHTSELQSLMRISYDVFCLQKK